LLIWKRWIRKFGVSTEQDGKDSLVAKAVPVYSSFSMSSSRYNNSGQMQLELTAFLFCCNMPGTAPMPTSSKYGLGSVWTKQLF